MEMKEFNGTTDFLIDKEAGIAVVTLEEIEELIEAKIVTNIFLRLWHNTTRDGDEFEEIFELVFGERYADDEEDDDDAE